ncbi:MULTISPECIES: STN domain-containing protein [Pseudomonas]|uniref:STN domain-containing protein n=1 Tax=Pseudomonas rhodesiae TaxID=76760 RepID=A0A8I1E8C5_9PSED|nr:MULTISPECIES: STN domain-containing protein [Pseudomonas]MBI6599472.1 STN domain-containing protein [Pseudomonas sp. S4_EA_1b]MBI6626683.1 STN domain-containing protein [Pseudomonas rhodesiae]
MKPVERISLHLQARSLSTVLTVSLLCFGRTGSSCELNDAHLFRIDANNLSETLLLIGRISGCTVVFKPESARDYHSHPIQGLLNVREAMRQALIGSNLEMLQTRNGSLTVQMLSANRRSLVKE